MAQTSDPAAATTVTTTRKHTFRAMTMATSTITSDPGILCFHHCNVKVFCFTLPHVCPSCNVPLHSGCRWKRDARLEERANNTNDNGENENEFDEAEEEEDDDAEERSPGYGPAISMKLIPFRLPYPFVRATQYPCAIVLRPTTGDFLNDYNNATDLHIAVTTSNGSIVEFDRYGLRRHCSSGADNMPEWWQCLLVGDVPEPWYDYWDDVLMQICRESNRWSVQHYHEDTHNCYTFVLAFLHALGYDKLSEAAHSKTVFCEKYIVPRTTTAGKYISLYRKLRDVGVYVHRHNQSSSSSSGKFSQQTGGGGKGGGLGKMRSYLKAAASGGGSGGSPKSTPSARTKMKFSSAFGLATRSPSLCTIEE